jgi:putative ABC transport system permease protein
MYTLSLRGIRSHLGRLVLTGLAIAMSVGFLSGTFILFPTVTKMIDGLIGQSISGVDVVVRRQQLSGAGENGAAPLSQALSDKIAQVPGVTNVQAMVYASAAISTTEGEGLGSGEAATWASSPFRVASVAEGRTPELANEIVIDRGTAKTNKLQIGDPIRVALDGAAPRPATIVGLAKFGEADSSGGSVSVFVTADAIRAAPGRANAVDWVLVAGEGDESALRTAVKTALSDGVEAITGAEYRQEQKATFGQSITIFKGIIGGFAAISFLVGTFLIANTFSIVVAQRSREIALLRALGALRKQVKRMVLAEAAIVGAVCSFIGLGLGVATAKALIALLRSSTGMPKPPALVMPPSAFIIGLLVGIGTTIAAAWLPILRGTKIEPIAALRNDDILIKHRPSRVRLGAAMMMLALGAGLFAAPIDSKKFLVGIGATFVVLIGMILVAPTLVSFFFGALKPLFGRTVTGELAVDGARRTPRRTAATAAAMMMGLALVTGALTLVNSMKTSLSGSLTKQLAKTSLIVSDGLVTDETVTDVLKVANVAKVAAIGDGQFVTNDIVKDLTVIDTSRDVSATSLVDLRVTQGVALQDLGVDEVLIYKDVADDGVRVGSFMDMKFRTSGQKRLKIVGVFDDNSITRNYVINGATYRKHFLHAYFYQMLIASDSSNPNGVGIANLKTKVANTLSGRGFALDTVGGFVKKQNQQLDGMLTFIFGLIGVSMVIALLGVVNTMALSVLERTREIGMLRAVGMTRRQVRQTIRREAAMVTAFGATLGICAGLPIGIGLVKALASVGITQLAIPTQSIVLVACIAMVAGVLAALLPARRASRLDVLGAIGHS